MCGCFGNMHTYTFCVLYSFYCFFVLLFHLCIFILICFVCTSVRTTATKWQLNCGSSSSNFKEAFSFDDLVQNPNCSLIYILLTFIWCWSLLYVNFSRTFENEVGYNVGLYLTILFTSPFSTNGFIMEYLKWKGNIQSLWRIAERGEWLTEIKGFQLRNIIVWSEWSKSVKYCVRDRCLCYECMSAELPVESYSVLFSLLMVFIVLSVVSINAVIC